MGVDAYTLTMSALNDNMAETHEQGGCVVQHTYSKSRGRAAFQAVK